MPHRIYPGSFFLEVRAHLETLVEKTVPLQRCERELLVKGPHLFLDGVLEY